ncbi:hypothetical protein [Chryseobacterium sp. JV274]|uniref:hypothetical protein n=1 Tax=Chryseobacterium sp. JV274 TaxID=1932669 RepID=UPI000987A1AD|nr:hypothetical protein [Chryseobacterium sp. JV274]
MDNIEDKLEIIEKGFSIPAGKLINLYNVVKEKNFMTYEDWEEINNLGIPILNKLSSVTGLSIEQLRTTILKKGIPFDHFREAVLSYFVTLQ